jgi:hypothetical protein
VRAEIIDGLCRRYRALPSQVLKEDARVLRMLHVLELGHREEDEGGEADG